MIALQGFLVGVLLIILVRAKDFTDEEREDKEELLVDKYFEDDDEYIHDGTL